MTKNALAFRNKQNIQGKVFFLQKFSKNVILYSNYSISKSVFRSPNVSDGTAKHMEVYFMQLHKQWDYSA